MYSHIVKLLLLLLFLCNILSNIQTVIKVSDFVCSLNNYSVFQKKWRQNRNHNNCDKSY